MRVFTIVFAAFALVLPAHAQSDWKAAAREDIEAAYAILLKNHPAAAPEVGDAGFTQRLERGRASGLARAETASRYEDYVAVMRSFAAAVEDPHVVWAPNADLQPRTPPEPGPRRGAAGFGVRNADGVVWIGLASLDNRGAEVVRQLAQTPAVLVQAHRIVIDLRGNAGGNEAQGQQLAALIFGQEATNVARRRPPPGCPASLMRASEGALRRLASSGAEQELRAVRAALAEGRAFAQPIPQSCLSPPPEPASASASKGRVVVITDGGCMSSCPGVVDLFRRLGAVHVGHATKPRLRYMETDVEPLPSGRGRIQLVRRIAFFWPPRTEPLAPAHHFAGDIADTGAVRAWIAGLPL